MVRITKKRRGKKEKKRNKNMKKKHLFRIASMFVMTLLLPLLPVLMYMGYEQVIIPFLHPISIKEQQIFRIVIFGIPVSLIIAYGYITREKITSILSGVFLIPLFIIYSWILCALADHYFTIERLIGYLRMQLIPPTNATFMLINGLTGYFASRGTKVSLLVAILFGILFSLFVLGID